MHILCLIWQPHVVDHEWLEKKNILSIWTGTFRRNPLRIMLRIMLFVTFVTYQPPSTNGIKWGLKSNGSSSP